jgi:hypothetical protein
VDNNYLDLGMSESGPPVSPTRLRGAPNLPVTSRLADALRPPAPERFEEEGHHSSRGGAARCRGSSGLLQRHSRR